MRSQLLLFVVLSLLLVAGCSESASPADSAAPDSGADVGIDSSGDGPTGEATAGDAYVHDLHAPDLGAIKPLSFVTFAPGTFTMGSPTTESCRNPQGTFETQHPVTLTRGFEMATTEVTQGLFESLMWFNPSKFSTCKDCPVEMITWHQAVMLCNLLSDKKGLTRCYDCTGSGKFASCTEGKAYGGNKIYDCPGYRLPTEAEWEYAYRAGTTTPYYNGAIKSCDKQDSTADKIGHYKENSGGKSHPVGQLAPNSMGLYDMAGNVWEWCHDWFFNKLGSAAVTDPAGGSEKNYRSTRGGSWFGFVYNLRAARRFYKGPTYTCHGIGMRIARTVKTAPDAGVADAGADAAGADLGGDQ